MTFTCKYAIGARVHIEAVDRPGRVDAVMVDTTGPQYRIIYWDNAERHCVWMYDWELLPPKDKSGGVK